ncbi:hypothetical protein [Paenibacillus sp. YN15]|uniref:hypothetical protein n=1 Tax=Paenibacillus sp. YN15 TaxID=1742774 RepID=UPI000DCE5FDE|nr:hypothetical protein [Paenibacillus sp. YN15]RAV06517.1 hypothetical protein DQG13_01400 [Paenibacillus sp. YN15]
MMAPRKRKKPRRQVRLDRMMRLLFRLSHRTVVRLINGLFDETFDPADVKLVYEDAKPPAAEGKRAANRGGVSGLEGNHGPDPGAAEAAA